MTLEQIKHTIEDAIPGSIAYIYDPNHDGQHLQAIVVSDAFANLSLVKQHQMVMLPLKQAFHQSVHALALKTMTPLQWKNYRKEQSIQ